jgi:hypothetical protein
MSLYSFAKKHFQLFTWRNTFVITHSSLYKEMNSFLDVIFHNAHFQITSVKKNHSPRDLLEKDITVCITQDN